MSYGREGKTPRLYLWRLLFRRDDGHVLAECWKIGITGGAPEERLAAWSGWLGQASLLSVEAVRPFANAIGWSTEIVSVSEILPWEDAVRLEQVLQEKYRAASLGNEFFRPHPDFGPSFFGRYRPAENMRLALE